eukprot:67807_1
MADKLEFNPGALSIFIGLLLLVVTLFIGFMLIKDGGTSGTGRTCGNVYGIDQPNTPYKLQTMDQYLEEKKNEQIRELNHREYGKTDEQKSPSLLSIAESEDVIMNHRLAEGKKNGHNSVKSPYMSHKMALRKMKNEQKQNPGPITLLPARECGITDFKMFTSPTEVKIQFKDLQYADVKAYSFKYYAVFESNKSVSRYLSRTEIVGDRMGGDSDQKQFTWNCKWSKTICDELKETLMYITEIHVTKEFNNKPKQVAVVSAADIDFQAEDNMILVD